MIIYKIIYKIKNVSDTEIRIYDCIWESHILRLFRLVSERPEIAAQFFRTFLSETLLKVQNTGLRELIL